MSTRPFVSPLLAVLGVGGMLVAASVAIHYRNKATQLERELGAVVARTGDPLPVGASTRQLTESPAVGKTMRSLHGDGAGDGIPPTGLVIRSDVDARPDKPSDEVLSNNDEPTFVITPKMREESARRREEEALLRVQANEPALDAMTRATNYFASRKTSGMTPEHLAEFNTMTKILGETVELKQALIAGVGIGTRTRIASTIRSNMVALAQMLETERSREYYDLAVGMGHTPAQASEFVNYINLISSNTSVSAIFPDAVQRGADRGGRGVRIGTSR